MTTLDFDQRLSLTEQLAEVLSYEDPERGYPEDVAWEVIDAWLPVYYHDIAQAWQNARFPTVEDTGLIALERGGDISHIMQVALYEQARDWVYDLWRDYSEEDVLTVEQALTACNVYLAVKGANTYARNGKRVGKVMA